MLPCAAGKRSSIYRGVTRHRWTGRYEAHLWDTSTWNQNQNKKGKQVYLGAYDDEEAAARAYDLAALKYWGAGTLINFPICSSVQFLSWKPWSVPCYTATVPWLDVAVIFFLVSYAEILSGGILRL